MFDSVKQSMYESFRPMLPLPLWQKLLALAIAFMVIVGVYFSLGWSPLQLEIEQQQAQTKVQQLKLIKNQRLAHNLPRKQREYAELEKQLKVALNMLPKKSQIPDLLESVSWAGKDSGLEFSSFKPGGEVTRQIYAEVPVTFNISGSFRQLLTFLKRVGEMPRIVDVNHLKLSVDRNGTDLSVSGQAVTYRFIEEQPEKTRAGGRR
ncbi:MAG: pilus assembly protein PilO [Zetaproteobacteria bacterium CG12_big_fil_rev_8_21_14_0_65_54_13]|nr:MAG: pilus assembly protein PilO [Zetaproteobacteria bacterium CG23_combo_of_CG06-09_8_20_14_all_54_7]PIW50602.1 MAG: pilus assembly protein PilO [Zetaproteobacteria bacterium CG12_big_fil_rev_8_21_14_0_65_54_13]PIX54440.1 MAG: pilus assembly protein PilO [Zetaproteobacteria bacterium CG_4_10_14_3_um_filter_54_28]PJA28840.1 MAG: pilus assembly protein PilO [Zetaproteobacteria bacterium CG_4_9_14_3_um_filter_54_145]